MNLINSNITAVSYKLPFVTFRTDPKFDKFQAGYPEIFSRRLIDIPFRKLTKPLDKPFNDFNEIPNIKFENYTDVQKVILLNLYNQTDISHPANPSELKTIKGTVTKNDVVSPYAEVRLHDKISGKIIKKIWCDANGAFTFVDLYPSKDWYIVAFDDKGEMNSVILSGVRT